MKIDSGFLYHEYYGEQVINYLWFFGIIIGTFLLKRAFANLLTRFSCQFTIRATYKQHKNELKGMIFKPIERLLEVIMTFVAFNQISDLLDSIVIYHSFSKKEKLNIKLGDIAEDIFLFLFIIFLARLIMRIVDFIYYMHITKAQEESNNSRLQMLPLIKELSKIATWLISIFWVLGGVFHVNVPALITGLGIGGVAIALAGKETVENFIASFTILFDKPFLVGDWVKLGDFEGKVERIGFRSTRIRAYDNSAIVIPNQKLVSQNLINFTARSTQGMKVVFNIRYGISTEKMRK